ncbi:hypothetical protein SAMN04489732_1291, partial [Amycolatopsis saalfeldensis]
MRSREAEASRRVRLPAAATPRKLRERCESAVRRLPIPAPFTLEGFLEQVGDHSGRRIELLPAIL